MTDSERLQRLTDDLLTLVRVDHGVRSPGVVDLAGMLTEQMAERAHIDRVGWDGEQLWESLERDARIYARHDGRGQRLNLSSQATGHAVRQQRGRQRVL